MDIQLNDVLVMKKTHPCGEKRWLVLRTGADFRLRCLGCGHEVMTPRFKDNFCDRFVRQPIVSAAAIIILVTTAAEATQNYASFWGRQPYGI